MSKIDEILDDLKENTIKFNINLLSDKTKTLTFRPIKTKDQKVLTVEKAENDGTEDFEIRNFKSVLKLVDLLLIKSPVTIADMLVPDFVWLLINIRAKSIGETLELTGTCHSCKEKFDLNINLLENLKKIEGKKNINNIIKLTNRISIHLGQLNVEDMVNILIGDKRDRNQNSMSSLIKKVELDGEVLDVSFETKVKMVDELSKYNLDKLNDYAKNTTFGISVEKSYECPKCKHKGKYTFDSYDIVSFF